MSDKKELYLVLAKKYFIEILNGTKKEEYRGFTDFYTDRLCIFDDDGNWVDMQKYDLIRFQLGYSENAPQMLVELKEITLQVDDDSDENLTSENANFALILGDIVDKINCESLN